jgi:hypothetical protein
LLYVELACRALLVGVFAVSLAGKLRGGGAYADFRRSVVQWRVLSRGWSTAAAAGAAVGEAGVVLFLAPPWPGWLGFALAGALLTAFTAGISLALRRGRAAVCRCFGVSAAPLSAAHVVRNLLLLGVCVIGTVGASGSTGAAPTVPGSAMALLVAAVGVLFVVRFDDVVALMVPAVSAAGAGDRVSGRNNQR